VKFVQKSSLATRALVLSASILLAGCAAIPASGPTGAQVRSQIGGDKDSLGITLVEVRSAADLPLEEKPAPTFGQDYVPPPPTELVGAGDVLDITVYESGISCSAVRLDCRLAKWILLPKENGYLQPGSATAAQSMCRSSVNCRLRA